MMPTATATATATEIARHGPHPSAENNWFDAALIQGIA